jgi:hypothetical protein
MRSHSHSRSASFPTSSLLLALVFSLTIPALVLAAPAAKATGPDACELVSMTAIHTIVGKHAPVVRHSPPTERDGVTRSSCVFQSSGNAGVLNLSAFASAEDAAKHLDEYADGVTKAGGTVVAEQVGSDAARFITPAGGTGQMFVVHGNVLVGAAVTRQKEGATPWQLDHSRELAKAATSAM